MTMFSALALRHLLSGTPPGLAELRDHRNPGQTQAITASDPGEDKTHRAYLWSYSIGAFDPIKAVVYDFADSRAGRHAQAFQGEWRGTLTQQRLRWLQGADRPRGDGRRLRGARAAQVLRSRGPEPDRQRGARGHWRTLRCQTRAELSSTSMPGSGPPHPRTPARLAARAAHPSPQRLGHRPRHPLQPQALGRAHALRR